MLGAGWQNRMTNDGVVAILGKFLSLLSEQIVRSPATSPASPSVQNVSQNPAVSVAGPAYHRPANAKAIPGRLSESQVQAVLAESQSEKDAATQEVRRADQPLSQALRAFESVFSDPRQRAQAMTQPIAELQGRLGTELLPISVEDVDTMDAIFDRCLRIAQMRSAGDETGRQYGPGANSPAYMKAFLSRNSASEHQQSDMRLRDALRALAMISSAQSEVLHIEEALDGGDLRGANEQFVSLANDGGTRIRGIAEYVQESFQFQGDVASYLKLASTPSSTTVSTATRFQSIAAEESRISSSANMPLTAAFLQRQVDAEKASLKQQLENASSVHIDPALYGPEVQKRSTDVSKQAELESETARLDALNKALKPSEALSAITNDPNAMKSVRAWYGDALAQTLEAKEQELKSAWLAQTSLTAHVEGLRIEQDQIEARKQAKLAEQQRLHDQEIARKEALVNERNSLAGTITNSVLVITMLDEKFRLTEVMGYQMEAQKRRTEMFSLLRKDHAMLTASLWTEVNAAFQRVLPGLTVWQASHAESLLSECRGFGK